MKPIDIVLLVLIGAVLILAVRSWVRRRKSGKCCGDCSSCGSCPNKKK